MQQLPTHELSTTELLFEYAELFAQNTHLTAGQTARQSILRHALNERLSVDSVKFSEVMVTSLLAASEVENTKRFGRPKTIMQAKIALKQEIEHVEKLCFTPTFL